MYSGVCDGGGVRENVVDGVAHRIHIHIAHSIHITPLTHHTHHTHITCKGDPGYSASVNSILYRYSEWLAWGDAPFLSYDAPSPPPPPHCAPWQPSTRATKPL
jgi:hypothetical protein